MVANSTVSRRLDSLGKPLGFDLGYLLVCVVCLPAIWPILEPTFFATTDGLYHLYRVVDLDFCIRGWDLYPRWLPKLMFGYGYPVLNYYAPLTYYVAELFHLLGAGFIASIEITFVAGFILSALFMYLYAKEIIGRGCGLVAAAAYVYLPYHLSDCYVKGAVAEFFAFVFLPLILWAFHRLVMRTDARYLPLAAASHAGLILTHNLPALVFSPFLLAYVLVLSALRRETKALVYAFSAILMALCLSAFYWLPVLLESSYVLVGRVTPAAIEYVGQLVPFAELFSPSFIYRYYPDSLGGIGLPLSTAEVGLATLSIVALIRSWNNLDRSTRCHLLFFMGTSLAALFMVVQPSSFLWTSIPMLRYLQPPSRFLLVASVSNALLIGSALRTFYPAKNQSGQTEGLTKCLLPAVAAALATTAIVMLAHLGRLTVTPERLPGREEVLTEDTVDLATAAEVDYAIAAMVRLWGNTWGLEYFPAWVEVPREDFFLPIQKPASDAESQIPGGTPGVALGKQGPLSKTLKVQAGSQLQLSFHTFYFPGWQFFIDGEAARTYPSGPLGLVTTDMGPGEHEIVLLFRNTPARALGTLVSWAGASALLFSGLALTKRKSLLLVPLVLVAALIPLVWWHVRTSPSAQYPTTLEATLANQVKLLGFHVDRTSYRPGDTIGVTLYWLALQDMNQDYKVFVHLTDEAETRLVAQSDRWPVYNFSPTTRWQTGEIVWDRHEVQIPADTAPGSYTLSTGMYLLETMRNLDVLGDDGSPQGVSVTLTIIQIAP
jgi:hypothetical protein